MSLWLWWDFVYSLIRPLTGRDRICICAHTFTAVPVHEPLGPRRRAGGGGVQDAPAPVLDQNQGLKGREGVRVCFPSSDRERVSPSIFRVLCLVFEYTRSYVPWLKVGGREGDYKSADRPRPAVRMCGGRAGARREMVCVYERERKKVHAQLLLIYMCTNT